MRPSIAARRYAEAAFQVSRQDGNSQTWQQNLESAAGTLAAEQLRLYFQDPAIGEQEKLDTLQKLFDGFPVHILNLFRVLVVHRRLGLIPGVAREFADLHRAAQGIVDAQVTVARPLSDAEQSQVRRALSAAIGKTVEVALAIDPEILGGIVIRFGDRLIDASVAGNLRRLRQEIAV
ncbi:MAG: F0F1 ATP synthase subunit delta [Chloroflexota bacterium]